MQLRIRPRVIPDGSGGKTRTNAGSVEKHGFDPGEDPWRKWQPSVLNSWTESLMGFETMGPKVTTTGN